MPITFREKKNLIVQRRACVAIITIVTTIIIIIKVVPFWPAATPYRTTS